MRGLFFFPIAVPKHRKSQEPQTFGTGQGNLKSSTNKIEACTVQSESSKCKKGAELRPRSDLPMNSMVVEKSVSSEVSMDNGSMDAAPGLLTDLRVARVRVGTSSDPTSGFPIGLVGKESACTAGDLGSVPGSGRSPGEGNGNRLQDSCLENPMDRGARQATVHGIAKSQTRLCD